MNQWKKQFVFYFDILEIYFAKTIVNTDQFYHIKKSLLIPLPIPHKLVPTCKSLLNSPVCKSNCF